MKRISLALLGLLLATPMLANAQDGAAAADKVYPPLPSLEMLPPAAATPALPSSTSNSHKKINTRVARKSATPPVSLVVSDASRAYLSGVEQEINLALQK